MTNKKWVCIINLSVLWGEMMNINISELISDKIESIDINLDFDLDASKLLKDFNIIEASPISFSGKIYREGEKILIDANFSGEIIFRCSRCLTEYKENISGDIQFDILDTEEENNGDDYLNGDNLDLSGIMEEAITFSLPMKTLCSEDCKGLCANCGKDLNKVECNCNVEKIDPRLEKLKFFFSKNEEV